MSGEQKSLQDFHSDSLPLGGRGDVDGHDCKVEGPFGHVAGIEPALSRLFQEGVEVGLLTRNGPSRVHHVQTGVDLQKKNGLTEERFRSVVGQSSSSPDLPG